MSPLKNEFSWSFSRYNCFQDCKRRYYYSYYGSWGGWEPDASEATRDIYMLKNLTNFPMWKGSCIHKAIAFVLKAMQVNSPRSYPETVEYLTDMMNTDWLGSRLGRYKKDPKTYIGLVEHYREYGINDDYINVFIQDALDIFYNFHYSKAFLDIVEKKSKILSVETMDSHLVDGVKVWIVADLVVRKPDEIHIYDWKTGGINTSDTSMLQLEIYYNYLSQIYPTERFFLHLVYLTHKITKDIKINFGIKTSTLELISNSILEMKSRLTYIDQNVALIEDFPLTDDRVKCLQCNFKELCGR